jgi:hypothetical protein
VLINLVKDSFRIPMGIPEAVNRRRTDSIMIKRKMTKGQTMIYKSVHLSHAARSYLASYKTHCIIDYMCFIYNTHTLLFDNQIRCIQDDYVGEKLPLEICTIVDYGINMI